MRVRKTGNKRGSVHTLSREPVLLFVFSLQQKRHPQGVVFVGES